MKLLATDFDKTLCVYKDYLKNINYVNKFVDLENVFVIVTGRHIGSLLEDIKDQHIKYNYLICNDGGIIFDNNLKVIYQKDIPQNIVKAIAEIYENSDCLDDWYIDTGLTITKDKNSTGNGLIGRIKDREKAYQLLKYIKENYTDIDGYISERWINITEKSVNKGSGIKELINILNIEPSNVYTIGDEINDVPMSLYNYNSYRMSDSVIELRGKTIRAYNSVYELVVDILKDGS